MPEMEVYEYEACWLPEGKIMKEKWEPNEYTMMQEGHLRYVINRLMGAEKKIHTVLELGAGFGRLTKILCDNYDIKQYTVADISPDQITNLGKLHLSPPPKAHVVDLTKVQADFFTSHQVDLVLCGEFLMHIMPEHIEHIFQIIKNANPKYIINMDYYPIDAVKRNLSVHNFIHDYSSLYKGIDRQVAFHRIYEYQGIFYSIV